MYGEIENKLIQDNYDYKVTRFVYIHKVNRDFHKVIILVTHHEEGNLPLAYIQFYFDGKGYDLEPVPCHGNNLKKDKPRHSTNASVRDTIRKLSMQGLKVKEVLYKYTIYPDQIYDISRKSKNKTDEYCLKFLTSLLPKEIALMHLFGMYIMGMISVYS